jgi:uncharacterized protein YndB with AHSA1/START domain
MDDLGIYVRHDGRPAVRFVRTYRHPVERVWAAVTDPEQVGRWFPTRMRFDPRVGGTITFSGDANMPETTGEILAYDPPHRLGFTWGPDELHLTLEPEGADGCRFILVNVLSDGQAAARNAAGWHVCLAELAKALDGTASGGPHSADAEPWDVVYKEYEGSGMPSGAPIPGR